jgi:flagellar motor switch protein FliN/FliY
MSDENEDQQNESFSQDDIDSLMADAGESGDPPPEDPPAVEEKSSQEMTYDQIEDTGVGKEPEKEYAIGEPMANDVTAIYDIPVQISAVLGRSNMQVSQLLKLGRGAVVELDRKVGEAIDIYVNNRLVARGEVVVVEDKLGITMTEIVKSDRT